MKDLSILSDSLLDSRPLALPVAMTRRTPLFSIGKEIYSVNSFITYAQNFRYKSDGSGVKSYNQLMDEFKRAKVEEYYRSHLEDYNPEFRNQMKSFSAMPSTSGMSGFRRGSMQVRAMSGSESA